MEVKKFAPLKSLMTEISKLTSPCCIIKFFIYFEVLNRERFPYSITLIEAFFQRWKLFIRIGVFFGLKHLLDCIIEFINLFKLHIECFFADQLSWQHILAFKLIHGNLEPVSLALTVHMSNNVSAWSKRSNKKAKTFILVHKALLVKLESTVHQNISLNYWF